MQYIIREYIAAKDEMPSCLPIISVYATKTVAERSRKMLKSVIKSGPARGAGTSEKTENKENLIALYTAFE